MDSSSGLHTSPTALGRRMRTFAWGPSKSFRGWLRVLT
jgi:hypothetical protein